MRTEKIRIFTDVNRTQVTRLFDKAVKEWDPCKRSDIVKRCKKDPMFKYNLIGAMIFAGDYYTRPVKDIKLDATFKALYAVNDFLGYNIVPSLTYDAGSIIVFNVCKKIGVTAYIQE